MTNDVGFIGVADRELRIEGSRPAPLTPLVEVCRVTKEYARGSERIRAIDAVSLTVEPGEMVALLGPSGSGKSTLLHVLGGLDVPTVGTVRVAGWDFAEASDADLTDLRNQHIGFIFQFFNLLPALTAWENVAVPALISGAPLRRLRPRAMALLGKVGLADRSDHRPCQLSGGEMQRVAIARALMNEPELILADEPTGNLDSRSSAEIIGLLRSTAREGRAVVVATHDVAVAQTSDRQIKLMDGRLQGAGPTGASLSISERTG